MNILSIYEFIRRLILWTVGIAAFLILGWTILIFAILKYEQTYNPSGYARFKTKNPISTAPVTVKMGEVVLKIPENYFMYMPLHDNEGDPDGLDFVLLVLMPDFEPLTEANMAEFADFQGLGRKLDVLVSYKGHARTGKESFLTFYNLRDKKPRPDNPSSPTPSVTDAEFGYKSFKYIDDDELFRGSIDDPKDYIDCMPKTLVIPPGGEPIPYYPSCERIILIGKDITVQFNFSRDYLRDAHSIEQHLIDTLNRFRVSGPALEFIE